MDRSSPWRILVRALVHADVGRSVIRSRLADGAVARRGNSTPEHFGQPAHDKGAGPCRSRITWCRRNLRLQSGIADPEHLAGEAVAMLAEQVRDEVCDLVGCARPVDF